MTKVSKFAQQMRRWRKANNLRQAEAAEKARIEERIWKKIESGQLKPDVCMAFKINRVIE